MTESEAPAGEQALELLALGDSERARAILDRGCREGDVLATLVNRLLAPSTEAPPHPASSLDPSTLSDSGRAVTHLLLARTALAEGRVDDLARHAQAATAAPGLPPWIRLRAASVQQAAYRFTGDEAHLTEGLDIAAEVADRIELPHMAVIARGILSTLHLLTGALYQVEECARAAIELAQAAGLQADPGAALAHQFLGYALFEWNRLDEAYAELERAWALAAPNARGVRSGVARTMTELALARGSEEESASWFRILETYVSEPMTLRNREWLAAVRARHGSPRKQHLRELDAWRQRYRYRSGRLQALSDLEAASRLHELGHLLDALEATRQWPDLVVTAETILRGSRGGRAWFAARAHASRAVALEAVGRPREADEALREALEVGRLGGMTRTYTEGSPLRTRLLARAAAASRTRADAQRVLAASGLAVVQPEEGLTPRQLDVLSQVAAGLSNRDTARALGLSESTVRTHLRAVHRKWGVPTRTAAVAEARRRGLI